MENNKIVAIVGMTGSGKSAVSDKLTERGFQFLRFGQIVLDEVKKRVGKKSDPELEKQIREGLRKKHGMAAIAIMNKPKIDKLLEKSDVVIDGLYSWSEYKFLKEKYGDRLSVVAVLACPKTRYARLTNRKKIDPKLRNRPLNPEQAKNRDYAEIENIEKAGPIVMADYSIINEDSLEDLYRKIDGVLK